MLYTDICDKSLVMALDYIQWCSLHWTTYYMILTMPSVDFSMPPTEHHFYSMLVKSNSNWWSHLTYIKVLKHTADDTDF